MPELDNVIANLELLPLRLNESKNAKIGDRQLSYAQRLFQAGLLTAEGLRKVQNAMLALGFQDREGLRQPTPLESAPPPKEPIGLNSDAPPLHSTSYQF